MYRKAGILVVVMLVLSTIPIVGIATPIDKKTSDDESTLENTRWYFGCYVEIEGFTYGLLRNLYLPNINENNDTFCLRWINRFIDNATVSIYRKEGGTLLHEQVDVREFHLIGFFGFFNFEHEPLILKGKVLAIQLYDHWTNPG